MMKLSLLAASFVGFVVGLAVGWEVANRHAVHLVESVFPSTKQASAGTGARSEITRLPNGKIKVKFEPIIAELTPKE